MPGASPQPAARSSWALLAAGLAGGGLVLASILARRRLLWEQRHRLLLQAAAEPPTKQPKRRKVRPAVSITAEDRTAPCRPVVSALRPGSDARDDPSTLIRCDPRDDLRTGAAVLLLPGGNYDECDLRFPLRVATWLTELGLVVYLLRYRLRSEGHYWPAQEEDCRDAMRRIRAEAAEDRAGSPVGVFGFSAGGHLASLAATTFAGADRPDFHVLVYPTTNVETPAWDPWKARFGYPGPELNTYSKVTASTPPLFVAVSSADEVSSYAENTRPYCEACKRHGVSTELVLASMGPHGHPMVDTWTEPCERWLRAHRWAAK